MLYKNIIRPILFKFDAEHVHDFTLWCLSIINKSKIINDLMFKALGYSSPRLKQKLFGLYFRTPIGLTAGMDKNISAPLVWASFGFGWAQLGSVTYQAQPGNKKPRLWRMPHDKSIVVYFGLSNVGAEKLAEKFKKDTRYFKKRGLLSISIAKSNEAAMENAAKDYAQSFEILSPLAEIITINLSCPNVKNFTGLQKKELLEPILNKITELNKNRQPIWLKIGNDLNKQELDDIIYLVKKYNIDAIVAANLSKSRENLNLKSPNRNKPGGISGAPIAQKANQIISYLYKHSENKYKIVGVGGIFTAQDAYDKLKAGANLLQIATGFIYGGPFSIKKINQGLDRLLKQDNFKSISEAVGLDSHKYNL